ncbi:sensor histidine kinase [Streptomyces sp. NPDC056411]|uniref:sensor histidine kinase n=1 Tax=Streptomyces sp. NPDC056411 TaxID=3345813 RepID=UPI0035D90899
MRLITSAYAARARRIVQRADGACSKLSAPPPLSASVERGDPHEQGGLPWSTLAARSLALCLVLLAAAVAGGRAWLVGEAALAAGWVAAVGWVAFAAWSVLAFLATARGTDAKRSVAQLLLLGGTVLAEGLVLTWAPPLAAAAAPLLFAAVMSGAAGLPVPVSTGLLAGGVLALVCGDLLTAPGSTGQWGVAVWTLTLIIFQLVGLTRRSARVQHQQAQLLLDQSRQMQEERQRTAALDERARIAREIHDVLAHSLGALSVQLEVVDALMESEPPRTQEAAERVRKARRIAVEGLAETRRAITALRTDTAPLADAVRALADSLRERHAGPVRAEVTGVVRPLPDEVSLCLVRVAQEALGNVAKHAPGQEAELVLAYEPARVRLTVRSALPASDGPPTAGHALGGYGLAGMRERLQLIGGTLAAGPGPEGWTVRAEVAA